MQEQLHYWITAYGYFGIFGLLMLGIVGLPVPDETLLTLTGFLISKGELRLVPAYLAAAGGSSCGITASYLLGRCFGLPLLHRYGRYIHVTEERIERTHAWFQRAGKWSLTFGYFILGVRHFTAYAAGMSELAFHDFAIFAYAGAIAWTALFIGLGYFLGERWEEVSAQAEHHVLAAALVALVVGGAYLLYRKRKAA